MTLIERIYKDRVRSRVFKMSKDDAEIVHEMAIRFLGLLEKFPVYEFLARAMLVYRHPMLETNVFGVQFHNPLGLAAGFDKYCQVYSRAIPACGWGFCEVGGITLLGQDGNPRPRLLRNEELLALWNWMGFNNPGATAASMVMHRKPKSKIPVGLNVGKGKNTPLEKAPEEYAMIVYLLENFVDFIVVNPSSPNTPGLRDLQGPKNLRAIIYAVKKKSRKPVGIKIAPDLSDGQLTDIVQVCRETKVDFIVATNTTVNRGNLGGWNIPAYGGVSGKPLWTKSLQILRDLRKELQGDVAIISVGGIMCGEDVYSRIKNGADLCQLYTAWPYEGPDIVKRCLKELVGFLKADGFDNVSQAVGVDVPTYSSMQKTVSQGRS